LYDEVRRVRELLRDRRISAALQVLAVVLLWFTLSAYQTRRHVGGDGAPAPTFTLMDLSGRRVSLADYRHKKVVLHFFATWCGVCKAELPSVRAVQSGLDDDEVLLGIAADSDDPEALRRFAREHGLTYPILLAADDVLRAYGVDKFPTNYYVNGDGSVSSSAVGLSTLVGMNLRLFAASSD
jgi:peroxiredoxin